MIRRLLLLLVCWSSFVHAQSASTDTLFASRLEDLEGQTRSLARWKGKPVVVSFWARWCPPCRAEIPDLVELQRDFRGEGVSVLAIGLEDDIEPVREFAKAYEINYTVLIGKENALALMRTLGNTKMGLPFTLVIDSSGRTVLSKMGPVRRHELRAAVETALR